MPSGPTHSQPDTPPIFFLDRGLGVRFVADAIRARGYEVVTMADVYPSGSDQHVADDEWIALASSEGWVALTKDAAITRDHHEALAASNLRVFALSNANLTGLQMAERFIDNLHRVLQPARKPGPFVDIVTPSGLERRWPRADGQERK